MNGTIRLRKLARKSILWFGKHEGLSVQQIIDLQHHTYLRWVYFNCEEVGFLDEILDEIRVPEDMRIEKPGTNPEFHTQLREKLAEKMRFKDKMHFNKVRRIRKEYKELKTTNKSVKKKSVLQSYNLGRM